MQKWERNLGLMGNEKSRIANQWTGFYVIGTSVMKDLKG